MQFKDKGMLSMSYQGFSQIVWVKNGQAYSWNVNKYRENIKSKGQPNGMIFKFQLRQKFERDISSIAQQDAKNPLK